MILFIHNVLLFKGMKINFKNENENENYINGAHTSETTLL